MSDHDCGIVSQSTNTHLQIWACFSFEVRVSVRLCFTVSGFFVAVLFLFFLINYHISLDYLVRFETTLSFLAAMMPLILMKGKKSVKISSKCLQCLDFFFNVLHCSKICGLLRWILVLIFRIKITISLDLIMFCIYLEVVDCYCGFAVNFQFQQSKKTPTQMLLDTPEGDPRQRSVFLEIHTYYTCNFGLQIHEKDNEVGRTQGRKV